LGGLAISPITYILESFKIQFQITPPPNTSSPTQSHTSSPNKQIIANTIKQLKTTRGLYSTTARETLAMGVYFYTFHTLKQHTDSTLLSGALTGVASWTTTYPIDVIMSRQVAQNITIKQAIQQGNLWKGYRVCIARAMLVNAANFKIYETVIHSTTLDKYLDLNLNLK